MTHKLYCIRFDEANEVSECDRKLLIEKIKKLTLKGGLFYFPARQFPIEQVYLG